jgi:hypothetical protein
VSDPQWEEITQQMKAVERQTAYGQLSPLGKLVHALLGIGAITTLLCYLLLIVLATIFTAKALWP